MSTSPSRNSRRSTTKSPPRRPLSERSQSDNNEQRHSTTPSIRIVADNGPSAYGKSPFPTLPAHILPPSSNYGPKTFSYYQDAPVSNENNPTNTTSLPGTDEASLLSLPEDLRSSPGNRASIDTTESSDADTLAHYDSSLSPTLSSRFSQTITTPSTPTLQEEEPKSVKLPQAPDNLARHSQSTIRLVIPSRSNDVPPLSRKQLEPSSVSSALPGTSTEKKERRPSSPTSKTFHASHYAITPSNDNHTGPAKPAEPQSPSTKSKHAPTLGASSSTDSVVYSDASYSVVKVIGPRSTTSLPSTSHASHSDPDDTTVIKYPVVQQQTASGSWATVSEHPEQQSRMNDDFPRPSGWSSRLSTIPSESEPGSRSLSSGPGSPDPAARSPRLRRVIGSIVSSTEGDNDHFDPSASSIAIPAPLFSHPTGRKLPLPPRRDSDEEEDTLGDLTSPTLQPKRSGYLTRIRGLSRPGSSESMKSQMSFTGDSLSWVKRFYSGGEWPALESPYTTPSHSTSRLTTATSGTTTSPISDAFPAEIYRPRNRPREERIRRNVRHQPSVDTVESQPRSEGTWSDRFRRPLWSSSGWGSGIFSPHLHRDRREAGGINAWSVPSLEDPTQRPFGPVARQVLLFCFGFVFPFAWFIAAFLPIPAKPSTLDPNAPLEEGMPRRSDPNYLRRNPGALASLERLEKQYVKANWWRSLNRIMCFAGLLIIGAIVALVILALRMRGTL